jgi:hypothetical protein
MKQNKFACVKCRETQGRAILNLWAFVLIELGIETDWWNEHTDKVGVTVWNQIDLNGCVYKACWLHEILGSHSGFAEYSSFVGRRKHYGP